MKAVIQRVNSAELRVGNDIVSAIKQGMVVYFCVEKGDTEELAQNFADKLAKLRIFEDAQGKMNLSLAEVDGEVLFVPQFTLAADLSHGNRPGFQGAELPARANELYLYTADRLRELGVPTRLGVFGADMTIDQQNAGPVTVIWEAKP